MSTMQDRVDMFKLPVALLNHQIGDPIHISFPQYNNSCFDEMIIRSVCIDCDSDDLFSIWYIDYRKNEIPVAIINGDKNTICPMTNLC